MLNELDILNRSYDFYVSGRVRKQFNTVFLLNDHKLIDNSELYHVNVDSCELIKLDQHVRYSSENDEDMRKYILKTAAYFLNTCNIATYEKYKDTEFVNSFNSLMKEVANHEK